MQPLTLPFATQLTASQDEYKHAHKFFEFFYITAGKITHKCNGVTDSLSEGDAVLICESTLRYEHDKFIDDTTPDYVERELKLPVLMVPNDGYKLLCAMLGEKADDECEVIYG